MNENFYLVCEPADILVINSERYGAWRELADVQGVIYWNREGLVRIVSNEVLDNALHVYADYRDMIVAGRLQIMPGAACQIRWEQARESKS